MFCDHLLKHGNGSVIDLETQKNIHTSFILTLKLLCRTGRGQYFDKTTSKKQRAPGSAEQYPCMEEDNILTKQLAKDKDA